MYIPVKKYNPFYHMIDHAVGKMGTGKNYIFMTPPIKA